MAKAFTPEQREELNKQIVELVRLNGRGTVRQLADETGISRCAVSRLSRELAASGDLYISGSGIFLSAQARKDWQNARKKLSRVKPKTSVVVDPDLIWSLPDGEIRRYDRRLNMICHDCRKVKLCSVCWLFIREIFRRWRSEYRHHDNDRYAPKFRSGTSRLALHHVPYMAMAGFHFPETVEKTAQTGTTPEGIRSVL